MRPKYKVGDKVRAKKDFTRNKVSKGGIYEVVKVDFTPMMGTPIYTLKGITVTWYLYPEIFEFVSKAEPFTDQEYEEIFI